MLLALLAVACGGSVDAKLAEVRALQDAGDFQATVEPLREVLASEPDHGEANYLLGLALVQTRQPSLAVWPLRKAAADEEFAVMAGLLLATNLAAMGSIDESVRAADGVLAVEPDNAMALQVRATANVNAGRLDDALRDADHLTALNAKDHQGYALRAMALAKAGRNEEATRALEELVKVTADEAPPVRARSCIALAVHMAEAEDPGASAAFERCVTEFPSDAVVLDQAEGFYDAAGRHDEATNLWKTAMESDPDNFAVRARYATRLESVGRSDEAEAVLVEGTELFADATAWGRLATFYQNRGDAEAAVAALEKAIELTNGRVEPLQFRYADLLVSAGRLDEAEAIGDSMKEEVYRDLVKGRVLLAREQTAAALEAFEAALARWPNNAPARYLAGGAAEKLGDRAKALAHYREAVRADTAATDAGLSAALIHLNNGEYADAITIVNKHLAERKTHLGEARTVLIRALVGAGRYDNARTIAKELEATPGWETSGVLEAAAIERSAKGPAAAAALIAGSGVDLTDPEHSDLLRALVEDRFNQGDDAGALAAATRAATAHPDAPGLLDIQGRALSRAGRVEEARAAFDHALAIAPDFGPAHSALGHLALQSGDLDAAVAQLDAAGDADSAHLAAQIELQRGNRGEAESRLRAIVSESPEHAGACNDLAWLLAEDGKELDLALDLAARAARIDPRAEILDTLGWVQLKRGQAAAAVESFERSLGLNSDSASVRYRLGKAQQALGRSEEAEASFRDALGRGAFPEAREAQAELARLEGGAR